MMLHERLARNALVALSSVTSLLAASEALRPPEFAVKVRGNAFRSYSPDNVTVGEYRRTDDFVNASVTRESQNIWRLDLEAKTDLEAIYFPWQSKPTELTSAYFLYPYLLGKLEQADARAEPNRWWGLPYPGPAFAPFVILANEETAHIVAAVNWPAKSVVPMYANWRMILRYDDPVLKGKTSTTRVMNTAIVRAAGGDEPWLGAVDEYRRWLRPHLAVEQYPDWLLNADGFLNIQLENARAIGKEYFASISDAAARDFQWVMFWGQMSDYAGGCCSLVESLNPRYLPWLPEFIRTVRHEGWHIGLYSAPNYADTVRGRLDRSEGLAALTSWIAVNRKVGADSFYVDTIGRRQYGDPVVIENLFETGAVPHSSVIEGAVDIYEAASLVSGAITGGDLCGVPALIPNHSATTFPRLGRYLMRERPFFLGISNNDGDFWGKTRRWAQHKGCDYGKQCAVEGTCDYGTEYEALLLGTKLEFSPNDRNTVVEQIVRMRDRLNWWARRPMYMDTSGVDDRSARAAGVVVRRFEDREGASLIAVVNRGAVPGHYVKVKGTDVEIPRSVIALIEVKSQGRAASRGVRNPKRSRDVQSGGRS